MEVEFWQTQYFNQKEQFEELQKKYDDFKTNYDSFKNEYDKFKTVVERYEKSLKNISENIYWIGDRKVDQHIRNIGAIASLTLKGKTK